MGYVTVSHNLLFLLAIQQEMAASVSFASAIFSEKDMEQFAAANKKFVMEEKQRLLPDARQRIVYMIEAGEPRVQQSGYTSSAYCPHIPQLMYNDGV